MEFFPQNSSFSIALCTNNNNKQHQTQSFNNIHNNHLRGNQPLTSKKMTHQEDEMERGRSDVGTKMKTKEEGAVPEKN